MAVFKQILERLGLDNADGRPLWSYKTTFEEYEAIKEELKNEYKFLGYRTLRREAAIFVAEWWRRDYRGGTPSWELVYNTFSTNKSGVKDFENAARQGAEQLEITWERVN